MAETFAFWFGIVTGTIGTIAAVQQLLDSDWRPTLRIAIPVIFSISAFGLVAWSWSESRTESSESQQVDLLAFAPIKDLTVQERPLPKAIPPEIERDEVILTEHLELEKDQSYGAVYKTDGSFKLVKEVPPVRTFTTTIEGFRIQIANVVYDLPYKIMTASNSAEMQRIDIARQWRDDLFCSISAGVAPQRHLIQAEITSDTTDVWTVILKWGVE